ncbi:polysaccharide lyase family 1 protein [Aplosporella prunicola CBS 121167]|uniref:pectin lyase n=1 Tax=Aplosporella prunicola CBS 121167 TaxID=1176127 RepID=A0A6A6B3J0_9PEZI|nr:polysaccharide lyase family 1 protein [Aplosporella prunicola CBS 121167]KAF2138620.1 polysaccharide lyase family 1 protein [Aplosporella prunicola CBS 121167]
MQYRAISSALLLALLSPAAYAQVVGTPTGFAAGTTGGGSAEAAAPADIKELAEWLSDDQERVILIDKEFDFTGTEGTTKETGCAPWSDQCSTGAQLAINGANDWCGDKTPADVNYDNAALTALEVGSNKSIVGVGSKGVLKGKGLMLKNNVENIIIQNIHITELNPQYVWGGDALTLNGCDKVWIDHNKFSKIGRQMIVSGYEAAGHVTISNNEFDGKSDYSASCNNQHYWVWLFYGAKDWYTVQGNYLHDVSGRNPHIGTDDSQIVFHAVNNYWSNVGGHSFDVAAGCDILVEGNVFEKVDTPFTEESASGGSHIFNVPSGSESSCSSYLGRDCVANSVTGSGDFTKFDDEEALAGFSGLEKSIVEAKDASTVASDVVANAGVGKLSSSGSSSSGSGAAAGTPVSTPTPTPMKFRA